MACPVVAETSVGANHRQRIHRFMTPPALRTERPLAFEYREAYDEMFDATPADLLSKHGSKISPRPRAASAHHVVSGGELSGSNPHAQTKTPPKRGFVLRNSNAATPRLEFFAERAGQEIPNPRAASRRCPARE